MDGSTPAPRDFERVRADLIRFLLARFRFLGADEISDLADEALARLLRESRLQGKELDNPAGWLITVGANLARDRLKHRDTVPLSSEDSVEDDHTARLLERMTAKDHLDSAIAKAIRAGDDVAVKIVSEWLDLAEEEGRAPPSRRVGQRCGYSHTTVQQALTRFSQYLS